MRKPHDPDSPRERRQHPRFKSQAFIGIPVKLNPVPPFIGELQQGQLMGLSAGGMSILITDEIPIHGKYFLELTFPDRSVIKCNIRICRVIEQNGRHLMGIKFIDLPDYMEHKIKKMSADFIDCEGRIKRSEDEVCRLDCSFMNLCDKLQRIRGDEQVNRWLQLKLKIPS